MWRCFTYTRKKPYVESLDDLALSIKKPSKHRTIQMSYVTDDEIDLLRDMHNIPVPREPKQSFRVGDNIRISMTVQPLVNARKSYLSNR